MSKEDQEKAMDEMVAEGERLGLYETAADKQARDRNGYDRAVYLRRTGSGGWAIYSDKGFQLTDSIKYEYDMEAHEWARAWVSSFDNYRLVIEDETKED